MTGQGRPDPDDIDRRFAEIVEGLRRPEDRPAQPPERTATDHRPGPPPGMATDHRSYEPPEDEADDHFVPPPPPPLPAGDLHFWAILTGLVLGPLLVVLSAVFPVLESRWTAIGALVTVVGFVLLVLRLPRHRGDGDWGARV